MEVDVTSVVGTASIRDKICRTLPQRDKGEHEIACEVRCVQTNNQSAVHSLQVHSHSHRHKL